MSIILLLLNFLSLFIPVLLCVAFLTVYERKVMAAIQRRRGPDKVGFIGILQAFADAGKLILKETIIPRQANVILLIFAPIFSFGLALTSWSLIPFSASAVILDINVTILALFTLSAFNIYGVMFAGWASNSRYAFLGAIRAGAQMISYEVSLGLIFLSILVWAGTLNLYDLFEYQEYVWAIFPFLPIAIIAFFSLLAETARIPFDLPEAEGELVSGYNVEYSASSFAFFFIAEYTHVVLNTSLFALIFLNAASSIVGFAFKTLFLLTFICCVRAILPRYRYDLLMQLGWKVFLPLSLSFFIFTSSMVLLLA